MAVTDWWLRVLWPTRQCGSLPKLSWSPLKNVVESGGLVRAFPVSPNDARVAGLGPKVRKEDQAFPQERTSGSTLYSEDECVQRSHTHPRCESRQ